MIKSNDRLAQTMQSIIIVILYSQIINVNNISIAWLSIVCISVYISISVQSNLMVMPFEFHINKLKYKSCVIPGYL